MEMMLFILTAALLLTLTKTAYAYLDPGTGSYVFQVILAMILGALYTLKLYWGKIIMFLKGMFGKKEQPSNSLNQKGD